MDRMPQDNREASADSVAMDPEHLFRELEELRRHIEELEREKQRMEQALSSLREAEEKFRTFFHESLDVHIIADGESLLITDVNQTATRVLGYEERDLVGKGIDVLFPATAREDPEALFNSVESSDSVFESVMVERADRSTCPMDLSFTTIPWSHGVRVLFTLRDATERTRKDAELQYSATRDALTGLYNRKAILEQLQAALSSAKRHNTPLSVCMCDLDDFKEINDTYGHPAGDQALERFGELIRQCLRTEDLAGRFGGDEFCLGFPCIPAENAINGINRLRQRMAEEAIELRDGRSFTLSASFGLVDFDPETMDLQLLIEAADQDLYDTKRHEGKSER